MNEIEAVNMLLDAVGSGIVNTLDSPNPDTGAAMRVLRRKAKMELRKGWWFNTDYDVDYEPDTVTGEINVSPAISSIRMVDATIVRRNSKLYDKVNQTYRFTAIQTAFQQISLPSWDEMEHDMQVYCTYLAAVEFIRSELEDTALATEYGKDAGLALIELRKTHLRLLRLNVFQGDASRKLRGGVRPYNLANRGQGLLL